MGACLYGAVSVTYFEGKLKGIVMNEYKFCFIICTNNELYLNECIHYIEHLDVPEGYETELLTITDAKCMTQGYNEAMSQTDAKYKIYMHQDVFILNRYFLRDILAIFQSDTQIGMIGMVGYENVSADGLMWSVPRIGEVYIARHSSDYFPLESYRYSLARDHYTSVAEIDGFMMITAYDFPWNTQDLTGWDFYDAYQSLEFLIHGYKIVVPKQLHPWCMHDDGVILNMTNYNQYRKLFLKKYEKYLGMHCSDI